MLLCVSFCFLWILAFCSFPSWFFMAWKYSLFGIFFFIFFFILFLFVVSCYLSILHAFLYKKILHKKTWILNYFSSLKIFFEKGGMWGRNWAGLDKQLCYVCKVSGRKGGLLNCFVGLTRVGLEIYEKCRQTSSPFRSQDWMSEIVLL